MGWLWFEAGEIERCMNRDEVMDVGLYQGTWHKFRIGNLLRDIRDQPITEESLELYDHLTRMAVRVQNKEAEIRGIRGRINSNSEKQDRRLRRLHREIQEKITRQA